MEEAIRDEAIRKAEAERQAEAERKAEAEREVQEKIEQTKQDSKTNAAGPPVARDARAVGDPHLQNIHGERFDLLRPGNHVLLHIPRRERVEKVLLRVEAEVRRLGGQCADMYFHELNITGAWVPHGRTGGLRFQAGGVRERHPQWLSFGRVQVKVAHGSTLQGAPYLNFYVKHLGHTGFTVGGLLGEDDHTEAAMPSEACAHRLSLLQVAAPSEYSVTVFPVAEASFE
ncbi:unnamed protein product [Prorocentrum cordatum]|uniref:Uncharacterized protein n=1 Tax=Prorocentrum cordatum TaxID=2364126 RepID=A0ABN9QJY2_9DINO|nr:unnamed protein product [Polarella glacialis]